LIELLLRFKSDVIHQNDYGVRVHSVATQLVNKDMIEMLTWAEVGIGV